ncbi:MAG: L,D-transpeptidase [Hyphomicrobiales bacterium]|nr:L,D-transpeptidase [Hyphomicrobiales bacterium]
MNRRTFSLMALSSVVGGTALPWGSGRAAVRVNKTAEFLENGEYNWFPERSPGGPVLIIVSVPDQLVHVYRNGIRIAASTCSTGKPGHSTPTGVFKILQKDKHHRSSTYNNAPMPNMNRLTWSGVALHAGNLPGYPASHGCVRLPLEFSDLLFGITKLGMTVVIADEDSQPSEVVHPGMVLGDYARQEFAAVDGAVKAHQYSEGHSAPRSTSVVVSSKDRSMTIWENGSVVARGKVDIASPQQSLGDSVYTLTKVDGQSDKLTWVATGFSARWLGDGQAKSLRRIKAEPKIRQELERRMHQGMTLVTTDSAADTTTTASDFTVMTGLY